MCVDTNANGTTTTTPGALLVRVRERIDSGLQAEPGHETELHAVEALGHADLVVAALDGTGQPEVLRRVDRLQAHLRTAARSHHEAQNEALREAAQYVEAIQTTLRARATGTPKTADTSCSDATLDAPAGHALVTVDIDEATHETLRETYADAVAAGYAEPFPGFAVEHVRASYCVTVDGEPVERDE